MSLVLVQTPGATNANTYTTKAEASATGGYFETRLFSTAWTGATASDRSTALVWATSLLDDWSDWVGTRSTEEQSLDWPRFDVTDSDGYDFDSDIVPDFLKDATAELAAHLLKGDPTDAPDTLGFSRLKVASLELEVDKSDRDSETTIPDHVAAMIEPYCVVRTRGSGGVSKLQRA